MTIRKILSICFAAPLRWMYGRRTMAGACPAVPRWAWGALPRRLRIWLAYRVFGPAESSFSGCVANHSVLGPIFANSDNSFAISPASLLTLWQWLEQKRPRRILEFGSGLSTLALAQYARGEPHGKNDVRVTSIEHNPDWLEQTRAQLTERGLENFVDLIEAPLTEQRLLGKCRLAYSLDARQFGLAAGEQGFDFCLIDGPPREIGRAGSLALAVPHLAEGASIILDDAFRPEEEAAWREWQNAWPRALKTARLVLTPFNGLAIAQWHPAGRFEKHVGDLLTNHINQSIVTS